MCGVRGFGVQAGEVWVSEFGKLGTLGWLFALKLSELQAVRGKELAEAACFCKSLSCRMGFEASGFIDNPQSAPTSSKAGRREEWTSAPLSQSAEFVVAGWKRVQLAA